MSHAYLRLVGQCKEPRWDGRNHFFAAATAMRRILIERARRNMVLTDFVRCEVQ